MDPMPPKYVICTDYIFNNCSLGEYCNKIHVCPEYHSFGICSNRSECNEIHIQKGHREYLVSDIEDAYKKAMSLLKLTDFVIKQKYRDMIAIYRRHVKHIAIRDAKRVIKRQEWLKTQNTINKLEEDHAIYESKQNYDSKRLDQETVDEPNILENENFEMQDSEFFKSLLDKYGWPSK